MPHNTDIANRTPPRGATPKASYRDAVSSTYSTSGMDGTSRTKPVERWIPNHSPQRQRDEERRARRVLDDSDPETTVHYHSQTQAPFPIDPEAKPAADLFPVAVGATPNPPDPLSDRSEVSILQRDESDTQRLHSTEEDSEGERPSPDKVSTSSTETSHTHHRSADRRTSTHHEHGRHSVPAGASDRRLRQSSRSKGDEIYELKKSRKTYKNYAELLQQELQKSEATIGKLTQDLHAKDDEVRGLQQALQAKDQELLTWHQEAKKLHAIHRNAEAEIRRYRTQAAHDQELLDSRRKELQGTRAFLNTSNIHSGEEIVAMVKALNAEIFQAAASMTDMIVESSTGRTSATNVSAEPQPESVLVQAVGEEVTKLLQSNMAVDDYIALVQSALQAILNQQSDHIFRLWTSSGSSNDDLARMYAGIRQKQYQVVSRTWRALTKAETKKDVYQDQNARLFVADNVKNLFFVAGWWPSENPELETQFCSDIAGRISTILSLLQKLDEAIAGFTSMDLTLYLPSQGASFDPSTMDDADERASSRSPSSGVVLFTSEIGLKDMNIDRGEEDLILLKPKVVLQEAFFKAK
ncbi:hypothetical protein EV360DRAFT_71572 [Lentinula raphanica]|nr:hypothetical protein EV360DRAFT_71572 [Lentinula raphanica]